MPETIAIEPPRIFATFRYKNAAAAIDWLVGTLGFTVHARYDRKDGKVGHAELALGSSMIMIGDEADDAYGRMIGTSGATGGKSLYIVVDDVDALFARVEASGVKIEEGLTERDYGSREFICRDPEGNLWCFGTYWPKAHEGRSDPV